MAKNPIKPMGGITIHVGLDFGNTPAAIYSQIWPDGRWVILYELNSENMGIKRFYEDMMQPFQANHVNGFEFEYYGDPSGAKMDDTVYTCPFDILAEKGVYVRPGAVTIPARLEAVRNRLRMRNGIVISPECSRLIDGFAGGYVYKKVPGLIQGQELYSDKPDKGRHSHGMDAMAYIATVIFGSKEKDSEEEFLRKMVDDSKAVESMVGY